MCDRVVLLDGTEITAVGELVEYGLADADIISKGREDDCLCAVDDLQTTLLAAGRRWTPDQLWGGWQEMDELGRHWSEDAFVVIEAESDDWCTVLTPNPDYPYRVPGRGEKTF